MLTGLIIGVFVFIVLLLIYHEYFARNNIKDILVLDKYPYGYEEGQYKIKCVVSNIAVITYVYNKRLYCNLKNGQGYIVRTRKVGDKLIITSIIRK